MSKSIGFAAVAVTGALCLALFFRDTPVKAQQESCVFVESIGPRSLEAFEYSATQGATLRLINQPPMLLPKLIAGKPNPDFDRLYALLIKGFGNRTLRKVCTTGDEGNMILSTVGMRLSAPQSTTSPPPSTPPATGVQRVQICYKTGLRTNCAKVSDTGYLFSTN